MLQVPFSLYLFQTRHDLLCLNNDIHFVLFPNDETIVAIATPPGQGGIGIIRLSGPASISIADQLFRPAHGRQVSSLE